MAKKNKTAAPVHAEQSVSDAFATILRHNLDAAVQWEKAARSWDDIEGVHQVRVSFRRMRSALAVFRSAIPRKATRDWEEELRWCGNQLGMARDLDVFITEGLHSIQKKLLLPGEGKLAALAQQHRDQSYLTVRNMLDSDRYAAFKTGIVAWLDARGWEQGELKPKRRKRLASELLPFARLTLDKLERQVLEAGSNVDKHAAADMHKLRIKCKKLRYGAEFFSPLFSGMDDFVGHMKGLQDLLGVINDVSVMQHLLAELLQEEADHEVLQYAGGLVGWRRCQQEYELVNFDAYWDEFTHAKHPWWKKQETSD